jgi:hypothetical protein
MWAKVNRPALTRVALGILLCAAATAKTFWPDDGTAQLSARWGAWLPAGLALLELSLGLWLLAGLWAHWACRVAIVTFGIFALVSGTKALQGHETCACFGAVVGDMSPWLSLTIDVVAIALLLPCLTRQAGTPSSAAGKRFQSFAALTRPVLVLGLAGVGAAWVATAPQRGAPKLIVADDYLDIGDVWETSDFVWELPIHNRSERTITITRFQTTCSCLREVEPPSLVIGPKETANVTLKLDLNRRPRDKEQSDHFNLPIAATVEADPNSIAAIWGLHGRARRAYTISAPGVYLGEVTRGQAFDPQTISVTPVKPAQDLVVDYDRSLLTVSVEHRGNTFQMRIAPHAQAPPGTLQAELTIRAVCDDEERSPSVSVPVRGVVREDVQATPETVAFVAAELGGTLEETIVLRSFSGRPITVEGIETTSDDVTVQPMTGPQSVQNAFVITQTVARLGQQSSTIRFTVRAGNGGQKAIVEVPLTYHGLQPASSAVSDGA